MARGSLEAFAVETLVIKKSKALKKTEGRKAQSSCLAP